MPSERLPLALGFDCSGPACIVGDAGARPEGFDPLSGDSHEAMERGQAERLLPLIEAHLARRGLRWGDLDAIGVGTGPGNFTGVRIAVSAARGLALALGIPAIGVSEFDLAGSWASASPELVSVPAPRGQAYVQLLTGFKAPLGPPQLITPGEDRPDLRRPGLVVVGHEAAAIARGLSAAPSLRAPAPEAGIGRGGAIATIALRRLLDGGEVPRPAPLYVRPPDAAPPSEAPPALIG